MLTGHERHTREITLTRAASSLLVAAHLIVRRIVERHAGQIWTEVLPRLEAP